MKKYYETHPEAKIHLCQLYHGKKFGLNGSKVTPEWISEKARMSHMESFIGGFWYGNVRYNDNWYQYCKKFNNDFKERVRAYWNWQCVVCGKPEGETRHSVHHVHYNKKMCCDGSPHDVVALCMSCHCATHFHRDLWEKAFTDLIYSDEHNGKSFLTKEEMEALKKSG